MILFDEDHRDKLKEMIDDLFPEYNNIGMGHNDCVILPIEKKGWEHIHWFEFCITKLSQRIAENFNTIYPDEKTYLILDMITKKTKNYTDFSEIHPIDYLYETYQKTLENEK